jgi:hypothetical protein
MKENRSSKVESARGETEIKVVKERRKTGSVMNSTKFGNAPLLAQNTI